MINKNDDQLFSELDSEMLNEQISNDEFFDPIAEFEVSYSTNIIEKLVHLSRFGNLLTLVVGNNGCGKTRLLDKFLGVIDENSEVCHIKAQPLLSIDQLFQQVIESFAGQATFTGIPLTAKQYEDWADQLVATSGNRILIIDDAEVLSTSVLHELCQLSSMQQAKDTPHLHLILFGNYDLNNILEQASQGVLDEDGIYAIDIPALEDEEAISWLEYLFTNTASGLIPEQNELEKIVYKGHGNLALLEELVDEYAPVRRDLQDLEDEPEPWRISVVGYWFAILTVVIMIVLGTFFFQDEIIELTGIGTESEINPDISLNTVDEIINKVDEKTTSETTIELDETLVDSKNVRDVEEETVIDSGVIQVEEKSEFTDITPADNTSAEAEEPVSADLSNAEQSNTEQSKTESVTTEDTNIESDIDSVLDSANQTIVVTEPVVTKDDSYVLTADEQLLMAEPDENFAVQIIGLSKESSVKLFLAKYDISNMLYYRSVLNGKPWFIITLVSYNKKEDAVAARANLPADLIEFGPWIKSIKIIKKEISIAQDSASE